MFSIFKYFFRKKVYISVKKKKLISILQNKSLVINQ